MLVLVLLLPACLPWVVAILSHSPPLLRPSVLPSPPPPRSQGPLSDSVNTASGIVGDILRIARSIGAKDRGPEELAKS